MAFTKEDVTLTVKRLGQHGAHFQFRDLRKALAVESTDRNSISRLYNYLKQLLAEKAIEEVSGGGRRRNKYFRVTSCDRLHESTSWPTRPPRGPDRLARIEERLGNIEARLNELAAAWI